jgi:hypothetical protein
LTTKSECSAKSRPSTPGRRLATQVFCDLIVGFVAAAYILFVLFGGVQSPLLSLAVIIAIAYELLYRRIRKEDLN